MWGNPRGSMECVTRLYFYLVLPKVIRAFVKLQLFKRLVDMIKYACVLRGRTKSC